MRQIYIVLAPAMMVALLLCVLLAGLVSMVLDLMGVECGDWLGIFGDIGD